MLVAPASAGFLDDIQNQYITNINELPGNGNQGNPDRHIQSSGNIGPAWIDIVGFRNLSRDGDKYYIFGAPASLAIVQYGAEGNPPGRFDSIDKTVSFSQSGNNLIVSLNVVMKWHTVYCDRRGCFVNGRFVDKATFQDTELIPEQFSISNSSILINQYKYINVLSINSSSGITRYTVTTANGSVSHRMKAGVVEYTGKGVPYMNLTSIDTWICKGKGICNTRNEILMENNTQFNVSYETPYNTYYNAQNITINKARESTIEPYVFQLAWYLILVISGVYIMKRFTR